MQLKGIYNICQEIDIQKEGSKTNFVLLPSYYIYTFIALTY